MTLYHFRAALAQHPTATRFVVLEDEENENSISIQPRAAATSRLALKRNQADNETIIEALRELLVIRHGGNEEVVKSFFGEQKENSPLTAAELREILRRSDEAVPTTSIASQKSTPQRTLASHSSESEITTPLDDSNIDEYLGADIRSSLQTLEKITLAEDLVEKSDKATKDFKQLQNKKKLELRKKWEQKALASTIASDSEGYLTPGTFLQRAVLKNAQTAVATSLLSKGILPLPQPPEIKKPSAAERDVEDFTHIAEEKRTEARKASLAAKMIKAKGKSSKINLDQENSAYAAAEEAWTTTVTAYQDTIKKALKAAVDARDLTTASDEATAHVIYAHSAILEANAKRLEQNTPSNSISLHQAEALESAWHQAYQGYQEAITKAQAVALSDEAEEWGSDLANTEARKAFWMTVMTSQDTKQRAAAEALQTKARNLATEANQASVRASSAPDTIESHHWTTVLQKGIKAENEWREVFKNYQTNYGQTLNRFKNWWSEEIEKIVAYQASLATTIDSWKSQQAKSISRKRKEIADQYRVQAAASSEQAAVQLEKAVQTKAAGKESEGDSWDNEGNSLQSKADYEAKAAEATETGKTTLAAGYLQAAATSAQAASQWRKSAQTKAAGKESEGHKWFWEASSLQSKADYEAKAAEATEAGKATLATGYLQAATTSEKAAEQYRHSAQTEAAGKESEGGSWYKEGISLQSKADYEAKAAEATESGKTTLVSGYLQAATTSEMAAAQHRHAAQTKAAGKKSEGISWGREGSSLQSKADYEAKAAEATESGKIALASGYLQAAATSEKAAEQLRHATQTFAAGKESEGISWGNEGSSLQSKADYEAKAAEATESGKTTLASGYLQAASTSEMAAAQWSKAAQTFAAGKESEGISWGWEGASLQLKADYEAKAAKATESGKTTLAAGYLQAATTLEMAAAQWRQAAETKAAGKESEGISWHKEGFSLKSKADYEAKAAEATESGKTTLAAGYLQAAATSEMAAEQWKDSAIAKAEERESDYTRLWQAGQASQEKADKLAKEAEAISAP